MGNFVAFASVTAAISYLLEEVNRDVPGVKITTKPLDGVDTQNPVNGLNIFLYLVTPNSSIDAVDTLVTDAKGRPTNNPRLWLDLQFLITATSSENDDLVAQKILASAMRILNNHPILERDVIRKALRNREGLESSDLADQVETVRLTLNALSAEDITKVWSRFPNANFRASVAYTAQVVLLESKLVESEGVMGHISPAKVGQLLSPTIERIDPQIIEYGTEVPVTIIGSNLTAPSVSVEFDDHITTSVDPQRVSDKRIVVSIPKDIEPGIARVKVNHYLAAKENPGRADDSFIGKRSVLSSNEAPFVLAPRILKPRQEKISRGKQLTVEFEPPVSKGKVVFVYLGDNAYPATVVKGAATTENGKMGGAMIEIPAELEPGVYLLRLSVNGATSRLITDDNPRSPTFSKEIGPYIEVTS